MMLGGGAAQREPEWWCAKSGAVIGTSVSAQCRGLRRPQGQSRLHPAVAVHDGRVRRRRILRASRDQVHVRSALRTAMGVSPLGVRNTVNGSSGSARSWAPLTAAFLVLTRRLLSATQLARRI
jgi:hypothetical protein